MSIEPSIDDHVREWIGILDDKYTSTNQREVRLDLSHSLSFLALDIITHLCLGESFRCLENNADQYGFLAEVQAGVIFQQYISVLLEIKDFLFFVAGFSFIRSRLFPSTNDKTGIGRVMLVSFDTRCSCFKDGTKVCSAHSQNGRTKINWRWGKDRIAGRYAPIFSVQRSHARPSKH